ncbi:DinB family protein [Parapedobacter sp.]
MTAAIFEYIKQTRATFTQLIEGLGIDEINAIPDGFRNNIGWNFGHIVVSTQGLCYRRTNVQPDREIPFLSAYAKGTAPTNWINAEELEILKLEAVETILQIERDYENGVFASIVPYATATYGLQMDTIEKVFTVTLAHDNLHLGYATALRKAVYEQKSQLHK